MSNSLSPDYFDRLYAAKPDPWDFATSEYEADKYNQTISALTRESYANAFEIGCSIGVLTQLLARRCGQLLSIDVSEAALQQARERCAGLPNVEFRRLAVPDEHPDGLFDLTIVSEVGYYLNRIDLEKLAGNIHGHSARDGQLLLVHWTPVVPDYPLTGDQVHEYFLSLPEWDCVSHFKAPQYRIELLRRADEGD